MTKEDLFNPYDIPKQNVLDKTNTNKIVAPIIKAKAWIKFLGVMSYIYAVLLTLCTFGVGLVVAWMPFWMGYLLFTSGELLESSQDEDVNKALDKLRLAIKILGILAVIYLLLIFVALLALAVMPNVFELQPHAFIVRHLLF